MRNLSFILLIIFLQPGLAQENELFQTGTDSSAAYREQFTVTPDTMELAANEVPGAKRNCLSLISLGIIAASSGSVYYFHNQAEVAYRDYLHSGSISEMNRLYDSANRNDHYVSMSFIGVQIGIILLYKSLKNDS